MKLRDLIAEFDMEDGLQLCVDFVTGEFWSSDGGDFFLRTGDQARSMRRADFSPSSEK